MDARTFGNYLSRMRKAQGLTQAELAEQLHVTDKAVSRWERGIGLPDINTLEPLADALGLTLADLMHCRAPEEADAAPTIQLEDFFTMLRRQHTVDWHSVRTALLGLSIALALWGVLACPGTIAVHWYGLGDGSFRADGWMPSFLIFPLCAGIEFLSLDLLGLIGARSSHFVLPPEKFYRQRPSGRCTYSTAGGEKIFLREPQLIKEMPY